MFEKHKPLEVIATTIAISLLTSSGAVASMGRVANPPVLESNGAIVAQQQDAVEYLQQGINLYQQGKVEAAEAAFRQAIEMEPELAQAHANLGTVLANQNKIAEAIREFEEAVRLRPDMAILHYQLGVALYMENRSAEAIDSLKAARDLLNSEGKTKEAEQVEEAIAKIESES